MASAHSLRGLDVVNVFIADASRIGIVVAISVVGGDRGANARRRVHDRTRVKRMLLVLASAIVAFTCVTVVLLPKFAPLRPRSSRSASRKPSSHHAWRPSPLVPVRALLFAVIENKYGLKTLVR